jgi:hypothetical protein
LRSRPALAAARSIIRAKPAVVNGEPHSLTKTKGDASLSRCNRRRGPEFVSAQRVCARGAVLDAADMQHRGAEEGRLRGLNMTVPDCSVGRALPLHRCSPHGCARGNDGSRSGIA